VCNRISYVVWAALVCGWLCWTPEAHAHKMKLFAAVEGDTITGYAYFPGGGKAKHVKVTVRGPNGEAFGEVTTDDEGAFSFQARSRTDHVLTSESEDGHGATYTVAASELPESLPGMTVTAGGEVSTPAAAAPPPDNPAQTPPATPPVEVVERAVAAQIRPLREQLQHYEDLIRFRDVLGGIGYIVGVMGLISFLKTKKRAKDR